MKLATIMPPHLIRMDTSSYHLALGQELVRSRAYRTAFEYYGKYGHFTMVDNGAAEPEDERVDFEDILQAADDIDADEIILPDVIRDGPATVKATTNEKWWFIPQKNRMIVPQGTTMTEWIECLVGIHQTMEFATIGVAKHLEEFGLRTEIIQYLLKTGLGLMYNIHLLGVYREPIAEVLNAIHVGEVCRGIDTGAPVAYAQHGALLNDDEHYSLDWNKPANTTLVAKNVQLMTNACATRNRS